MAFTLQLGDAAPDFALPGSDGKTYTLADFQNAKLLIVAFTCNHCPAVIGTQDRLDRLYDEYAPKRVAMIGINSNETENHPTDDFEHMKQRAAELDLKYPCVRDESQKVAWAYGALRTPHFYVFDAEPQARVHRPAGRQPAQAGGGDDQRSQGCARRPARRPHAVHAADQPHGLQRQVEG